MRHAIQRGLPDERFDFESLLIDEYQQTLLPKDITGKLAMSRFP